MSSLVEEGRRSCTDEHEECAPVETLNASQGSSQLVLEGEVDCDNQSIDDDDGEFGDFEEATATISDQQNTDIPRTDIPSCSRSISCDSNSSLLNLSDTLDDINLWVMDNWISEGENRPSDSSSGELEVCDIFAKFDLSDEESRSLENLRPFHEKSLRLWALLCYIEETAALKFLWNESYSYIKFLDALAMNASFSGTNTNFASNSLNNFDSSTPSSNTNLVAGSKAPEAAIDSLSVPPADFDWTSSGLMNPLRSLGSSITAISAVLECDFFTDGTAHTSGPSILERDLQDLGLSNGCLNSPSTTTANNNLPVDFNELIRKNAINGHRNEMAEKKSVTTTKQYKKVEELSLGAQALHDRLPDHGFMLARSLMFPLNRHE